MQTDLEQQLDLMRRQIEEKDSEIARTISEIMALRGLIELGCERLDDHLNNKANLCDLAAIRAVKDGLLAESKQKQ